MSPYNTIKSTVEWGGLNKDGQVSVILAAWRATVLTKESVFQLERELSYKIMPDEFRNKETEQYVSL